MGAECHDGRAVVRWTGRTEHHRGRGTDRATRPFSGRRIDMAQHL